MYKKNPNLKLRYNLMTMLIYIIGIVLLVQLFNLQIIHGEEYRETSNTRLTRQSIIYAARGSILDANGKVIAGTKMAFSLELYKSKIDNNSFNNTIFKIINILEKNEDTYIDKFPITKDFKFNFSSEEKLKNWKESNKIDQNASPEEAIKVFKEKYEIEEENLQDARKIIAIRYLITIEGYSSTKSIKISEDISKESVLELSERNAEFAGLNIIIEPIREYKYGELASHIIGYLGKITEAELKNDTEDRYTMNDYVGRTGIEYVFERFLKGENGIKQIDMAVDGSVTEEYVEKEAIAGSDVILTIDLDLQKVSEEALEQAVIALKDEGKDSSFGAVVVMDVDTGEVLAMASYPTYNPDLFLGKMTDEEWQNMQEGNKLYSRALQGSYAPGSTFKMIPAIAALEEEVVTKTETINDTGIYPEGHNPVCWYYTRYHRGHGYVNIETAIQKSCNYFFYEMGKRLGIDTIEKYSRYFGLGGKTGIELPSETAGTLARREIAESKNGIWYLSDTLSASIGQSYNSFSPLQMAKYISILANGGKHIDTTIIKTIINSSGQEASKEKIEQYANNMLNNSNIEYENLDISEENLKTVLNGMKMVTSAAGGTAYSVFNNFEVEIGGKTGSAQAGTKVNGWFVGFAPFDEPEIAIAVILEDGSEGSYPATVVKKVFEQYFGLNNQEQEELIISE